MQVFSSDQIRFRSPIPESVHGNRRPCRRTQSPLIQKRRNPAVPRPRPASRQTGHGPEAEPNPISHPNPRISPRQRRLRQTIAARTQPEPAESRGSSIKIGRPCSKAHTDSSVPLVPNPISRSDPRISPRKQAALQTDTIRINPETAESRGPQTKTSQPPNRPRPRNRTKSNLDGQSPNWSTGSGHCGRRFQPRPHENSGTPRLFDHSQPVAQLGTH